MKESKGEEGGGERLAEAFRNYRLQKRLGILGCKEGVGGEARLRYTSDSSLSTGF